MNANYINSAPANSIDPTTLGLEVADYGGEHVEGTPLSTYIYGGATMAIVGVALYMARRCYQEKTSKINLKKEIKKRFRLGENDEFINAQRG